MRLLIYWIDTYQSMTQERYLKTIHIAWFFTSGNSLAQHVTLLMQQSVRRKAYRRGRLGQPIGPPGQRPIGLAVLGVQNTQPLP